MPRPAAQQTGRTSTSGARALLWAAACALPVALLLCKPALVNLWPAVRLRPTVRFTVSAASNCLCYTATLLAAPNRRSQAARARCVSRPCGLHTRRTRRRCTARADSAALYRAKTTACSTGRETSAWARSSPPTRRPPASSSAPLRAAASGASSLSSSASRA